MEKDIQFSRRDFLKAAGAVAGAGVLGVITKEVQGETPGEATPEYSFEPFILPQQAIESQGNATPTPHTIVEFPKPKVEVELSPQQEREKQVKRELANVQKIMSGHPEVFSKKKIEDVKIYYPIYRAVADKSKIPWYLVFLVHEAETGASAGKRGFAKDSYYKGAMQLDPQWTGAYMDTGAKGLSYLAKLPQRHKDDWKNIATGARILGANFKKYKRLGTDKAVLNALLLYSADNEALKRFKTFQKYEKLFPAAKKKKTSSRESLSRAS